MNKEVYLEKTVSVGKIYLSLEYFKKKTIVGCPGRNKGRTFEGMLVQFKLNYSHRKILCSVG